MTVIESDYNGFCKGVSFALSLLDKALETGTPVFLTGEIIHNTPVSKHYENLGVRIKDSKNVNGTVVVAAHGETDKNLEELTASACKVLNGTCPVVENRKSLIKQHFQEGKLVVLFVKSLSHAEVKTLINDNKDLNVISTCEELFDFIRKTSDSSRSLYVHTQTTFKKERTEEFLKALKPFYKDVILSSSVCPDCFLRQKDAKRIALASECVIVVGSSHSSNAGELVRVINSTGAKGVLIETEGGIPQEIYKYNTVGIISSASSSYDSFKAIVNRLKNTSSLL